MLQGATDFITDEPAIFTQKQTPFLISSDPSMDKRRSHQRAMSNSNNSNAGNNSMSNGEKESLTN